MQIYCLNLARSVERRNFIENNFSNEKIKYINAIDGIEFAIRDKKVIKGSTWDNYYKVKFIKDGILAKESKLPPTHVACNLSHIAALKEFLKTEEDYCVILEDDVKPSVNLKEAWNEGKTLKDIIIFPDECDMYYLCSATTSRNVIKVADTEGSIKQSYTLMGYAITRKGAEVCLSVAFPMYWLLDFQFPVCCYPKHKFNKNLLPEVLKNKPVIKAIAPIRKGYIEHSILANESYLGHEVNSNLHSTSKLRLKNKKYLEWLYKIEQTQVKHKQELRKLHNVKKEFSIK